MKLMVSPSDFDKDGRKGFGLHREMQADKAADRSTTSFKVAVDKSEVDDAVDDIGNTQQ